MRGVLNLNINEWNREALELLLVPDSVKQADENLGVVFQSADCGSKNILTTKLNYE